MKNGTAAETDQRQGQRQGQLLKDGPAAERGKRVRAAQMWLRGQRQGRLLKNGTAAERGQWRPQRRLCCSARPPVSWMSVGSCLVSQVTIGAKGCRVPGACSDLHPHVSDLRARGCFLVFLGSLCQEVELHVLEASIVRRMRADSSRVQWFSHVLTGQRLRNQARKEIVRRHRLPQCPERDCSAPWAAAVRRGLAGKRLFGAIGCRSATMGFSCTKWSAL